ncbi:hypothetical protein KL940_000645, partial [Ogataea angusta]
NTRTTLRVFAPTEITHPPPPRPPGRQTLGIGLIKVVSQNKITLLRPTWFTQYPSRRWVVDN